MSCTIKLDNYQGQYYPGDSIIGTVLCTFNNTKNIRGIVLELKGEERNSWTSFERHHGHGLHTGFHDHDHDHDHGFHDHGHGRTKKAVHYKGHETFLRKKETLHGEGEIGPGKFEYPINLQLPSNLPGTYKGKHGGVSYTLDVKVDRPYKFDYTDSVHLIVVSPVDLNLIRDRLQLEPMSYSEDKTMCCWCCTSGRLTVEAHFQKQAFVLGEEPSVRVDVTNMSNVNVESVKVELIMEVTSRATHPHANSKSDIELLASARDTGVGANGQRTYDFKLDVPQSTPIPNFSICQLFSQRCKIEVTAVLPGCRTNLKTMAYVTMGNIPLRDSGTQSNMMAPPYPTTKDGNPAPIGFAVPREAYAGPSAPPAEGGASAPPKEQEAGDQFVVVEGGSDKPWPAELPPPSYNEVTYPLLKK